MRFGLIAENPLERIGLAFGLVPAPMLGAYGVAFGPALMVATEIGLFGAARRGPADRGRHRRPLRAR